MSKRRRYVQNPALKKNPLVDEMPLACSDENEARALWERLRWPTGPVCPHCGSIDTYRMKGPVSESRGLHRCRDCKRQFSVRTGSVLEESLLPLRTWTRILWEMSSDKNGVSALEISRKCQITHKTALFALNRLRWAMAEHPGDGSPRLSGTVEGDEVFIGPVEKWKNNAARRASGPRKSGTQGKTAVLSLVQRGGAARSRVLPEVNAFNIRSFIREQMDVRARLVSDGNSAYVRGSRHPVAAHVQCNHGIKQYVVPGTDIHTNSVEGYFSRIRRSMHGVYHSVSVEHLPRYLAQWDWTHTTRKMNDGARIAALVRRAEGKRLMFKETQQRKAG